MPDVLLLGANFNFPKGSAGTNRAVEYARGFRDLGRDVLMIPLRSVDTLDMSGVYREIHWESVLPGVSRGLLGIFRRRHYPLLSVIALIRDGRIRRARLVICGTLPPAALFLLSIYCRMIRVPFYYEVYEEPFATTVSRRFSELGWRERFDWLLAWCKLPFIYLSWLFPQYVTVISMPLHHRVQAIRRWSGGGIVYVPTLSYTQTESTFVVEPSSGGDPYILHSGSWFLSKDGIDILLDSVRIAKDAGTPLRLILCGGSSTQALMVERLVKQMGIGDRVELRGYVDREELVALQRGALCLPIVKPKSRQNIYNMPQKIADYVQAGRPIILTPLPAYEGIFVDGENCLYTKFLDAGDLYLLLKRLINEPGLGERIGLGAFNTVVPKLHPTQYCKLMLEAL